VAGVLLDTHILLWWGSSPHKLAKSQAQLLEEMEERGEPVGISAITLWELAKMVSRGRLEIHEPVDLWLEEVENHPLISVFPLTARIVAESACLGDDFHQDPADQIIVATARCHGLKLMTDDDRIRKWGKVLLT
jgi:PIN domain nuclease of toxin-antitoxin system